MPSLLDLRRRIRAVKSTQQITKAMKMISASKLRRAQDRVMGARPFARQMARVLNSLASRVDPSTHPLLMEREPNPEAKTLLIVVTADKGLCGAFNTNIIRAAGAFIASSTDRQVALGLVGRKGRDFFRRRALEIRLEEIGIFQRVKYADAQRIARAAIDNEFKSVMQQRIATEQLLPIPKSAVDASVRRAGPIGPAAEPGPEGPGLRTAEQGDVDYLYEPAPAKIFEDLLPRHLEIQIYRALLESAAAEHAARMTAMDAASKNSG
jgi:F-type H+-transporting ATPase subunit gamma